MSLQPSAAASSLLSIYSNPSKIQNYSLPKNLIFYIAKNPKSSKVYIKLIKICKYFYLTNPIIVFNYLAVGDNCKCIKTWGIGDLEINGFIISNSFPYLKINDEKIWIIHALEINGSNDKNIASFLAPKIYRSDFFQMVIKNQVLTLDEFLLFNSTGRLNILNLNNTIIRNNDGKVVLIETLILKLENLERIDIFGNGYNYLTSETTKKLLEIPRFVKDFESFIIHQVPEMFDFETFIKGLDKETGYIGMEVHLYFENSISPAMKQRLQNYVDNLISYRDTDNRPPKIRFPGMTNFSKKRLNEKFDYYELINE